MFFANPLLAQNIFVSNGLIGTSSNNHVGINISDPTGTFEIKRTTFNYRTTENSPEFAGFPIQVKFGSPLSSEFVHHLTSSPDWVFNTIGNSNINRAFTFKKISQYDNTYPNVDMDLMVINLDSKVGIGTTNLNSDYRLFVRGGIRTEKMKIDLATTNGWADFVFEANYNLRPLLEVEKFIQTFKHLSDVPSAKDLVENGVDVLEMQKIQMQKIEELTLYLIELKKENEALKKRLEVLEKTKIK